MGFLETCRTVVENAAHPWIWYRRIARTAWALIGLAFLLPAAVLSAEILLTMRGESPELILPAALLIPGSLLPHVIFLAAGEYAAGTCAPGLWANLLRFAGYAAYFLIQGWGLIRIPRIKSRFLKDFGIVFLIDALACVRFVFICPVGSGIWHQAASGALIRLGVFFLLSEASKCEGRANFQRLCAAVIWLAEKNGIESDEEWDRYLKNTGSLAPLLSEFEAMEAKKYDQATGGKK